jgi:hypothetical protein
MDRSIPVILVMAGIVHLLPLAGVLGPERLSTLYGVAIQDPNLSILMRHRAVLFGLLGAFLVLAAFRPALQPLALIAGLVSVASFLVLCLMTGSYNTELARVFRVDLVALAGLIMAAGLSLVPR